MSEKQLAILAPIAQLVGSHLPDAEAQAWLVGGCVRDALLSRSVDDVDIATSANPRSLANALASATQGAAFPLGSSFGVWRVTPATQHSTYQIDVCPLVGGSIEADVAARDFTLNALAYDVRSGQLIDRVGGVEDLDRRILRVVSDTSFASDPLRILRAARIAHELGCHVEPATKQLARRDAHRADEPAGERTIAELERLICSDEARRGVRLADELGVLEVVWPEITACKGIAQSRFHHLDVFEHTLAVLDNCEDIERCHEYYLGEASDSLSTDERWILRLAALCHDLGKVRTRTVSDEGRVGFSGHDVAGATIVGELAQRWAMSNRYRDGVTLLVRTHLALGMLLHGPLDARARYRFLRSVEPYGRLAIMLSFADRLATSGVDDRSSWRRRHLTLARELWNELAQRTAAPDCEPLLDGLEIADAAGISPGPALGRLVAALREAQDLGEVRTPAEARALVRGLSEQL